MPLMSSIRPITWPDLSNKTMQELPAGTVVSIDGISYVRGDNCILLLDNAGHLQTISESLHKYTAKAIPRVIHGILNFHPLGF